MLNKKPIFVFAFARGGSDILTNLILSHPDICISSGETHKVFKGTRWDSKTRIVKKRLLYDFPICVISKQNYFNPRSMEQRRPIPIGLQQYIDKILYNGRFIAMIDTHNKYKTEGILYTRDEIAKCRLLTKALNGLIFTIDTFSQMYPDATFFGLTRNGFALCEGYIRRGIDLQTFGSWYHKIMTKMLQCEKRMPNFRLIKYETMVANPLKTLNEVCEFAELDIAKVAKIRMQGKKIMDATGKRRPVGGIRKQVYWYDKTSLQEYIKPNINENQIKNLSAETKSQFLNHAKDVMVQLDYL